MASPTFEYRHPRATSWLSGHVTAIYLLLNTALGAATGLAFWILLVRIAHIPTAEIGVGYAIVSLATTVALVAKGGLDTALLRSVAVADGREGARLLRFGTGIAVTSVAALCLALFVAASLGMPMPDLDVWGWPLVGAIAVLMVAIWLQDAWFLAEGRARSTFRRNLAFSGARLALPLPVAALAVPQPVPVAWALALALAALIGMALTRRRTEHPGRHVPRKEFLRSALHNAAGSAAEFLPGLVLVPLVLTINGPTEAGHFGMAWAVATMLFLATAAIGRAALTDIARKDVGVAAGIRKGGLQVAVVIVPAAIVGAVLAPFILSIFGAEYAAAARDALIILCLSAFFVAPAFLYLAVLRALQRTVPLIVFPAGMMLSLFLLAPSFSATWGLTGVAYAWILTNAPFGIYAAVRLVQMSKGVDDAALGGRADVE